MTDDFDKTLLNSYCNVWFGDQILDESFTFYKTYTLPVKKTLQEYREYIDAMPITDSPLVFGLHENASISYQTAQATEILETIVNTQPKDSGSGKGETREVVVERMADDILAKVSHHTHCLTRFAHSITPLCLMSRAPITLVAQALCDA